MKKYLNFLFFFNVILLLSHYNTNYAQNTWTGSVDNVWHRACNWSYGSIPSLNDTVEIQTSVTNPTITGNAHCKFLNILSNDVNAVTINSSLGGKLCISSNNGGVCSTTLTDSGGCSMPLPMGMSLSSFCGEIFIPSVYDNDYLPYTLSLLPGDTSINNADGTLEPQVLSHQGIIGTFGSGNDITIIFNYTAPSSGISYPAYNETKSIPPHLIEGGGSPINISFSYPSGVTSGTFGTITAKISASSTLNIRRLDVNSGSGKDFMGVLLTEFTEIPIDHLGNTDTFRIRITPGILDKEFGDGTHDDIYMPVFSNNCNMWLNNNLGAGYTSMNHTNFSIGKQATTATDTNAYGSLYQWGRYSDGHEFRLSGTTTTNVSVDIPGHPNYILEWNSPYDWRIPRNDNLWQGDTGINNPCPFGFSIPSLVDLSGEVTSWISNDSLGAFNSPLKFTLAGVRTWNPGNLDDLGVEGRYFTKTPNTFNIETLRITYTTATFYPSNRAAGKSIRCIKD